VRGEKKEKFDGLYGELKGFYGDFKKKGMVHHVHSDKNILC